MKLADAIKLNITKPADEFTDFEGELVGRVVREWENSYNQASNDSVRGNVRLEKWIEDSFGEKILFGTRAFRRVIRRMSEDLRNQRAWGMLPANLE